MAIETRISNEAYERLALAEHDRKWELRDGVLREKPGMTYAHNSLAIRLGLQLGPQLDWTKHELRVDAGRVHRPASTYFIPDVFVLPTAAATHLMDRDDLFEVYDRPLPLVVEVWSRSTGNYDVEEKLAVYKQRGDEEILSFHPFERTLTAWRRRPDGSYDETRYRAGIVELAALPGVTIDLDALFNG